MMHAHQEFSWAHYLKENTSNQKDRVEMETKGHTSLYYLLQSALDSWPHLDEERVAQNQ